MIMAGALAVASTTTADTAATMLQPLYVLQLLWLTKMKLVYTYAIPEASAFGLYELSS